MRTTHFPSRTTDFPALSRDRVTTLQVNLGYRCNQSCVHCHVNAGPARTEMMEVDAVDVVLRFLSARTVSVLDITGGAPELNPHFRQLVSRGRALGARVIDRCNLTVLEEPGQEETAYFLASHDVEITASLPCYLEENVDRQRGQGVFEKSLRALRRLNALGYGRDNSGLVMNFVHNPLGPALPAPQDELETDYKKALGERYGIVFNRLLTLTNMPIHRFGSMLASNGRLDEYMRLLRRAHRDESVQTVMCRNLISVDWRGIVYDCDFNQMLDLPLRFAGRQPVYLSELMKTDLTGNPIAVADHCYGCTAGQGSSCTGALIARPAPI